MAPSCSIVRIVIKHFKEAFQKALRGLEVGSFGFGCDSKDLWGTPQQPAIAANLRSPLAQGPAQQSSSTLSSQQSAASAPALTSQVVVFGGVFVSALACLSVG